MKQKQKLIGGRNKRFVQWWMAGRMKKRQLHCVAVSRLGSHYYKTGNVSPPSESKKRHSLIAGRPPGRSCVFNGSSKLWLLNFNTGTCHNLFISPISCSIVCHKIVRNKNFPYLRRRVACRCRRRRGLRRTSSLCSRRIIIMIINTNPRTGGWLAGMRCPRSPVVRHREETLSDMRVWSYLM